MVQVLELLWSGEKKVLREGNIKQCKIKPIALAVIKLCLSKGISK